MQNLKICLLLQLLTETEEWQSVLEAAREKGAKLVGWGPAEGMCCYLPFLEAHPRRMGVLYSQR